MVKRSVLMMAFRDTQMPPTLPPKPEQLRKMSLTVCGGSGQVLEKWEENPGQNAIMSLHNEN